MTRNNFNLGLILFAVSLAGLGLLQIASGEILAGRPMAWPENIPGKNAMAVLTGLMLFAAGVSAPMKKLPVLTLVAGLWILLYAASRNLFFIVSHLDYGFMLTNTGKSLTLGGGALLVAAVLSPQKTASSFVDGLLKRAVTIERLFIGFFFFASGVQHFLFGEFVKSLVPGWIPGALFWTYFAGAALCLAGLGLLTGIKAQLAAAISAWMVFVWLLVLHIPRAVGPFNNLNEWTAVCEATFVSGILFVLATQLEPTSRIKEL